MGCGVATSISLTGVPAKTPAPGEPLTPDQRQAIIDRDYVYGRLNEITLDVSTMGARLDALNERIFNPTNPIVTPTYNNNNNGPYYV